MSLGIPIMSVPRSLSASLICFAFGLGAPAAFAQQTPWFTIDNYTGITGNAPVTWLAEKEPYMPSRIEFYAVNTKLVCDGNDITTDVLNMKAQDLPQGYGDPRPGEKESRCYITTKDALKDPYDQLPFFSGQTPSDKLSIPYYVFVYPHDSYPWQRHAWVAQYNMFYPYNLGKKACGSVAPEDHCVGGRFLMGNHVADWEAVSILFVDGKMAGVHVGSHGNNIPDSASTYWAPNWGDLQFKDGAHPIVYSAHGSHGVYAKVGKFNYESPAHGDKFNDYTSQGTLWAPFGSIADPWGAHVVMPESIGSGYPYEFLLRQYEGRWGNRHLGQNGCEISVTLGVKCDFYLFSIPEDEYQLNNGPSMPNRRRDRLFFCCALAVKTSNGKYLGARNGGGIGGIKGGAVSTNGDGTSEDEIFTLEWVDQNAGTAALKTSFGAYLSFNTMPNSQTDTALVVTADKADSWETFDFVRLSSSELKFRIRAENGGYLKALRLGDVRGGQPALWYVHTDTTTRNQRETVTLEPALDRTDSAKAIIARTGN
jgi:hypothetical protein